MQQAGQCGLTPSLCLPQDVYDKVSYLSSLGKTQTAVVQRDADIGVAEAERDAGIRVRGRGPQRVGEGGAPTPRSVPGSPHPLGLSRVSFARCRKPSARRRCWT